jgi:hypothetical protein
MHDDELPEQEKIRFFGNFSKIKIIAFLQSSSTALHLQTTAPLFVHYLPMNKVLLDKNKNMYYTSLPTVHSYQHLSLIYGSFTHISK